MIFDILEKKILSLKRCFDFKFLATNLLIIFFTLSIFSFQRLSSFCGSNNFAKKTIVLDPGHGGDDGGAVSPSGVLEKNLNLEISLKLRNILETAGFNVIMTRQSDVALHDNVKNHKKRTDLNKRLKIIKNAQKNFGENTSFISIHQNNFSISKYSGTQIFFSPNNSKSEILAEKIKNPIVKMLQKNNKREIKMSGKEIFLLNESNLPSCLIECGFLSNPEEERLLQDDFYQNQLVFCIFCGICEYYSQN